MQRFGAALGDSDAASARLGGRFVRFSARCAHSNRGDEPVAAVGKPSADCNMSVLPESQALESVLNGDAVEPDCLQAGGVDFVR